MQNIKNQRNELWCRLRYKHGIHLSDPSIKTIESFFQDSIKSSIYHVGMYRVINVVFAVLMLAGWILLNNTPMIRWFIPCFFVLFLLYNIIHLLVNYVTYKRIKTEDDPDGE
jgi:Na+-translocating ferredoxin:NAD+ oxidoreductase RnfD subunit